ncbi:hypothetical protein ACT3TI_01185 [Psychrobacter sp. AOP22-C1-22]|uniref:hypothetical protein n=2 Tax=Psychrobacter TaxID=497 RepID=UPI0017877FE9|nr:hypothetical protein [Psychrobacter sp. FME6]MBE0405580.1 hypothetical protein [Psychrobacter sp. FME6]
MPPHAYVSVEESPETFKKNNEDIKQYWSFDDNPLNIGSLGVTFYEINFPSNDGTATFSYPNVPSLTVDNVGMTSGFYIHDKPKRGIQSVRIDFFVPNSQGSYGVTKKDAYVAVQKLFKQLEEQGWQNDRRVTSARISLQDSYAYVTDENVSSSFLNYQYPLTFDQFKQLPSLQFWDLRNGTDVFLDITMQYNFEEEINNYVYMISLDFSSEEIHINSYLSYDNPDDTMESVFIEAYPDLPQARLYAETQALEIGLDIQQDQPDYTLPLVLKETGIDTSKFVSIDPYKITYEEFMQRKEAGEDMTPYYENQTKANKPEITSQARGRCLAGQPCPKSGYWFTQAKSDSRAYFKQGDIMPDYPNNNWGEVIWQFDGEKG